MRKWLLIILLIGCCVFNLKAQLIKAGQPIDAYYYVDINPDTALSKKGLNGQDYTASYSFDFNHDGIYDYKLLNSYSEGHGGGGGGMQFVPLNNNQIAFSHFDTCYGNPDYYPAPSIASLHPMTKAFSDGEIINNHINWIDTLAYAWYSQQMLNRFSCFESIFKYEYLYLGVRMFANSDTIFGWIKMDNGKISAFASTAAPLSKQNYSKVYPNPFSENFTLETPYSSTLYFYDLQGQLLMSTYVSKGENKFDMGYFPNGFYILKLVNKFKTELHKICKR